MRYIFFLLLLTGANAQAQKILTLPEAVATALQSNYDIQLSKGDSLVAALDYSYRNAFFYPRINGAAGVTLNNNNQSQSFTDGTKRERNGIRSDNVSAQVALNWTLFDGMKMFVLRERAGVLVQLGSLLIKEQVINTVAQVINAYFGIVRQKQQLKAIQEQLSIDEERVKLSQYRLDIGSGAKPDVLQSKVDLNARKAARLNQQNVIIQLKQELNRLMNVNLQTDYDVADSIVYDKDIMLGDVRANALQTNPTLQVLQQNISLARLTLRERKADRWPIIAFNSAYTYNRTHNNAVVNPFTPLTNRNNGYNVGLTATIPIFNNFNVKRLVQQAELDIRLQQLQLSNQQQVVDLAVVNAYQQYIMQQQALQLEEENMVLARENVSIVLQTYRLGAATFIQLREAQQSLQDGYDRLIAARYQTKLAETELLRLQGKLIQ